MKYLFSIVFSIFYFKEKKLSFYASSLAIYLILSLFPALMIIMLLLNVLFVRTRYYEMLVSELQKLVSLKIIEYLNVTLTQFDKTFFSYGVLGILIALIFSTIFIRGFYETMMYLFEFERGKKKTKWILTFLTVFFIVLVLICMMIVKMLFTFVIAYVSNFVNVHYLESFYVKISYFITIWMLLTLLLFAILKNRYKFKDMALISAISIIIIGVFSKCYFILLNKSIYNALYGSLSAIILTIMYMWTIFNIFIMLLSNFYVNYNFDKFINRYFTVGKKSFLFFMYKIIYNVLRLNNYYLKNKSKFKNFIVLKYENKMFYLINEVECNGQKNNIYYFGY